MIINLVKMVDKIISNFTLQPFNIQQYKLKHILSTQGERFSRHAGHYSSLPRPPTSTKKGVIFGKIPNTSTSHLIDSLAEKGVSGRCLSAPTLGSVKILFRHDVFWKLKFPNLTSINFLLHNQDYLSASLSNSFPKL